MNAFEWTAWLPILLLIVALGIFPNMLFHVTDARSRVTPHDRRDRAQVLLAATDHVNPVFDWHALAPDIVIVATILVTLVADLVLPDRDAWQASRIAADRRARVARSRS